jgi:UDP-glucose 4-epimerase
MVTSYLGAKTLVTGADGFIGSHLTEALVAAGARVTALAQYNSFDSHGWLDDLAEATRAKVDLVRGDIRDAAFIDRLVRGQEIVFHLAALIAIPYSYVAPQS